MRGAIVTFLALIWAASAPAEGLRLFSMQSLQDGRAWEAVGRLEIGGEAFCTGALIADDLVLTAAHCLYDKRTNARVPIDDMKFLAGWRNGRASAYRKVRKAVHHPSYDFSQARKFNRVRNDIALLQLQHPIRNTTIIPFETDKRPQTGAHVGVVSYAHNRSEAPSLQETCEVLSNRNGVLVMSCSVDFGSSGSPVFSFDGDHPRIVSVVSAKATAQGRNVSLGTELEAPLQVLQAELTKQTRFKSVTQSTERSTTGAKFLRP